MGRRSNQLARFFRSVGLRRGRRRRHPDGEPARVPGGGLGGAALGALLRRHQLAPEPRRGRVHPGATAARACSSPRSLSNGARRRARGPDARVSRSSSAVDGELDQSTHRWNEVEAVRRRRPRRPDRGLRAALLLGHHGAAEGGQAPPPRDRASSSPTTKAPSPATGPPTRPARTRVYLSPAPLYHSAPLMSCMTIHRIGATVDRDGALRRRGVPRPDRATPGHARPVRPDDVRPDAEAAPRRCRARYDLSSLELVIHASAPCPIEVKRQMIEWWGPILHEYYGGTEGMGTTTIDSVEWLRTPAPSGARAAARSTSSATTEPRCRAGETGHRLLREHAQVRVPERSRARRRRSRRPTGGARSATSATSTRTATST